MRGKIVKGKLIKRFFAVIAFIIVSALVFDIKFNDILSIPEFLLLIFGTGLFYISANGITNGTGKFKASEFGENALLTGCFETLILIIGNINISNDTILDMKIFDIASNIRPLAYGFCIWLIFRNGSRDETAGGGNGEGRPTLDEYYKVFRDGGLTNREVETAILAVQGMTNAEIAYELGIAESTVKKHMSNIFEKLGITSREELKNALKNNGS